MYKAPVAETAFTLNHVAGLHDVRGKRPFSDLSEDMVDAILAAAVDDPEEATEWMPASVGAGRDGNRVALARYAAENRQETETPVLKDRVINGAESLAAARAALG